MSAMPDRLSHVHEPEGVDVSAFRKEALDDVIETIMLYSEYPMPPRPYPSDYPLPIPPRPKRQFDLREWVNEKIDPADLAQFYIQQITDYSNEADIRRMDEAAKVEQALREELRDSQIVNDRAEQLYEQSKERW